MPELHKVHGKLVRIAPNEVSIAEPTAIKQIYGNFSKYVSTAWNLNAKPTAGAGNKFQKSDWYRYAGFLQMILFLPRSCFGVQQCMARTQKV